MEVSKPLMKSESENAKAEISAINWVEINGMGEGESAIPIFDSAKYESNKKQADENSTVWNEYVNPTNDNANIMAIRLVILVMICESVSVFRMKLFSSG